MGIKNKKMKPLKLSLLLLMILNISVIACQRNLLSESESVEDAYEAKDNFGAHQDFFIPTLVWDLLEEKKVINSKGKIVPFVGESKRFEENVIVGLTLRLKEKTPGVLGGKNYEFKSKKSTGIYIDLAHYIKSPKGTFILSFEPSYTVNPVSAQVLFLSDSIARKDSPATGGEGQLLGSGCGKFFDVTKSYLKKIRKDGIEVNVTDGRHVSLLAGTFLIRVAQELGTRALTHLTVIDSNFPELLCDKVIGRKEK